MPTVVIAFVRADADQSPNMRASDHLAAYYRAMVVTFASIRRWEPTIALALATNAAPPAEYTAQLDALGVEQRSIPFGHEPPAGFYERFAASLYMLDALAAQSPAEDVIYLDPDVVCVRSLDRLVDVEAVGALPMPYPVDYDINGLTRGEAGALHGLLGELADAPEHFGGECYVVPGALVEQLVERAERAWSLALARHNEGASRFTTEEHVLSYALRGVPVRPLSSEVKRIWTAARYRTVDGRENALTLWHLPAEKDRGFVALYPCAVDRASWFWTAPPEEFRRRVATATGVAHRPPKRLARDLAGHVARRLSQ